MLTKYTLLIDNVLHELAPDTIKNWDEIECAYKRDNYSGVMRSFTSKFEFVNEAYDLLKALSLRDGIDAKAKLTIHTINNDWSWSPQFDCTLDFSSISWTRSVLTISCLDNSLAAMIKARKSTKYELEVGLDVPASDVLAYDRIEMLNYVNHTITGRQSNDDGTVTVKLFSHGNESNAAECVETYVMGDAETYEDSPFLYGDQTIDNESYLLQAQRDVRNLVVRAEVVCDETTINTKIDGMGESYTADSIDLFVARCDNDGHYSASDLSRFKVFGLTPEVVAQRVNLGTYPSYEALMAAHPSPGPNKCAVVEANGERQEYYTPIVSDYYTMMSEVVWILGTIHTYKFISAYTIESVAKDIKIGLLGRIFFNRDNADFGRLTWNSQKGCREAYFNLRGTLKFMWGSRGNTVDIKAIKPIDAIQSIVDKLTEGKIASEVHIAPGSKLYNTRILAAESIRDISGAKYYSSFNDFCEWMATVFGYTYYLGERTDTGQDIYFVPRSDLYRADTDIVDIENAVEVQYSIDNSLLYGTIEIGYSKQDYGKVCGRDEWNFLNTYTTGTDVSDKKLTLKSPYRADCYGIEFLAQERMKDQKDNKSDNGVFFVLCNSTKDAQGRLILSRTIVEGVRTSSVFNGLYSPIYCLEVNSGFITAMKSPLQLTFASSDGNSKVKVQMRPTCGNTTVSHPLFTAGVVEFSTDEAVPEHLMGDRLVRINDHGTIYTGYISEVKMRYAREKAYQYKLLVKSIDV